MIKGLTNQCGETIVSHGAGAANALGLATQVPMRDQTSGRSHRLKQGLQTVEDLHAPIWQLIFLGHGTGEVARALAPAVEVSWSKMLLVISPLQPGENSQHCCKR